MDPRPPIPIDLPSSVSTRSGFAEANSERMMRNILLLTAAFTGAAVVLLLQDDEGVWYRDGHGLSREQLASLEPILAGEAGPGTPVPMGEGEPSQVVEALPLLDGRRQAIGRLWVLHAPPFTLAESHREGLARAVTQLQGILTGDMAQREHRGVPRAPSAASFVPGLVHELHNFIFGISANLDAFEARFAGQEEIGRYGATIRRGLDRLNAFVGELKDFGDPQAPVWTEGSLGQLLRDVLEQLRPLSERFGVKVELHIDGPLPDLTMDEQSLRAAFLHLVGLGVQLEEPGGVIDLHLSTRNQGGRVLICGYLDGSGVKLKDMDQARLFEPFYMRGYGQGRLALPVARRVFESHGGNLAAGPGPGGGIRIGFMLPSALPPVPSVHPRA